MVCFKYIIVNTLHKGDNKGDYDDDDVQHIHISMQYNFDVARNGHHNPKGTSPGC
jgi:hypothetical protein